MYIILFLFVPERFELSRGNPMYLAGTRLNHSAKATFGFEEKIHDKKDNLLYINICIFHLIKCL